MVVHHTAKDSGRPVLRLGKSLRQREDVLGQSDGLKHDFAVLTAVWCLNALSLLREELLDERFYNGQAQDLVAVWSIAGTSL